MCQILKNGGGNMNNLSIQSFTTAISEDDYSYHVFSKSETYRTIYVEGKEDKIFYCEFLSGIDEWSQPNTKFIVCNGRDNVLDEAMNYLGKKKKFIVDLDYLPFPADKYSNLAVTTGYSMENFIFYQHNDRYNYSNIFKYLYKDKLQKKTDTIWESKYAEFEKELKKYKKSTLYYFAFLKTCVELSNSYEQLDVHRDIEEINYSEEVILESISSMNIYKKDLFLVRYEENKKAINDSNLMLIRGHNLFKIMLKFLRRDFKKLSKNDLYSLANNLTIPEEFKKYFI